MAGNPEANYVIDVPGVQDIIRIPPMESPDLKRQRIARMKQNETERPDWVNKVGHVAATLDNAQDLLYTALVLAKPILKRLPARFIPGIGWILFANDVVNLTTALISVFATGPSFKRNNANLLDILGTTRQGRWLKASNFLAKTPWLPFAIQGGQALQSLTGYGLTLGAPMGMVQDVLWAPYGAAQGKKISLRGPPPADFASKAANFLAAAAGMHGTNLPISHEDWSLLNAAHAVAQNELATPATAALLEARGGSIGAYQVPSVAPWSPSTRDALIEHGYDPDADYSPAPATTDQLPTIQSLSFTAIARADSWAVERRAADGPTSHGSIQQMVVHQAAAASVYAANGGEDTLHVTQDAPATVALRIADEGIIPDPGSSQLDLIAWQETIRFLSSWQSQIDDTSIQEASRAIWDAAHLPTYPIPPTLIRWRIDQDAWLAPWLNPTGKLVRTPITRFGTRFFSAKGINDRSIPPGF